MESEEVIEPVYLYTDSEIRCPKGDVTMDVATAASIGALVIAILAMFVAVLQALQQYYVTGQLIRLCDSVVFGKMPGQGRRVWEMRQLRFRVVYSIPQVSLRKDLWPTTLPHIPSYAKGPKTLPDLGLMNIRRRELTDSDVKIQRTSWVSYSAGEASWVSFCRVVQLSSGQSMALDLIQGDADRCPPDLANVPMQLSMRDIVTMALMTGMKCTQASFEEKSLSMQGLIGSITSSQHPLLGALLHFSPRNLSIEDIQDIPVGNDTVDPSWMARMWDEVVVAGTRYTRDERKQIERDEAIWVRRSRERAIVPVNRNRSPPPSSIYGLRNRSSVAFTSSRSSSRRTHQENTQQQDILRASFDEDSQTYWTRSDGDWHLDTRPAESNPPKAFRDMETMRPAPALRITGSKVNRFAWIKAWAAVFNNGKTNAQENKMDPFGAEIERGDMEPRSMHNLQYQKVEARSTTRSLVAGSVRRRSFRRDKGADLQPRWFIKDYVEAKQAENQEKDDQENHPNDGQLMIEWYDEEDQEIPELSGTQENVARIVLETWIRSRYGSDQQRAAFYAHKWQDAVRQRQLDRESQSRSRNSSLRRPVNTRTKSESRIRRGSSDYVPPSRSLDSHVRHLRTASRSSKQSLSSFGADSRNLTRRETINLKRNNGGSDTYHSPRGQSPLDRTRSRSSSFVRGRPVKKHVEYGDTSVVQVIGTDKQAIMGTESKISGSENQSEKREHSRVGFGVATRVIDLPSSSEEMASEETSDEDESPLQSHLPAEKASSASVKDSLSPDPENYNPPPKGILKPPKERFPEEPNPIREGVAPLKDAKLTGIPPEARWTKIDRRLVNPEALELGHERYEERPDHVIILRVLTKEEIQEYAAKTMEIREARATEHSRILRTPGRTTDSDEARGRRRRREDSLAPEEIKSSAPHSDGRSSVSERTPSKSESSSNPHVGFHDERPSVEPHNTSPSQYYSWRNVDSLTSPYEDSENGSMKSSRRSSYSFRFDEGNSDSSFTESDVEEIERVYSSKPHLEEIHSLSDGNETWNDLEDKTPKEEGEMNWFWACQIDVIPGYFATPWTTKFSTNVCIGAIVVIIDSLGILTDFSQPVYLESECHPRGLAWMHLGRSTFPPYGISANHHHGTVISGAYRTCSFPRFRAPLFEIELLRDYSFQVDHRLSSDAANLRSRLTELMALDAWLSYCGRQPEICGQAKGSDSDVKVAGAGDLLYTMPTLVERTMNSFTFEFANLKQTAMDGGQQPIRQIAENLLDTLGWKVEGLAPAEKLFALVAMLRASKMALCIAQGTDTSALRDILLNDVQVHLV